MFLKQVELSGFKSFADKTTIKFDDGVTVIIGPNGSGKSNISDALKWVLGEQSLKAIRGSSKEDVIFNGNQNRKPLGRSSVKIVVSNQDRLLPIDFNEVSISRKVYRSGESEYLINNSKCRLKDITNLFMDTGLSKGSYSIIGQGQIGDILTSGTYERRYIFEEAAGIVKYKHRKHLAENKLTSIKQDLLRLEDILSELERQLRSLKYQANKAERYRKLEQEVKGLRLINFSNSYTKLKKEITELEHEKETYINHKIELEKKLAESDADTETYKLEIIELDEKIYKTANKLNETEKNIQTNEINIINAKNKKEQLINNIENLKRYIEENEKKYNELDTNNQQSGEDLIKLEENYLEIAVDKGKYNKLLTDIETEIFEKQNVLEKYKNSIEIGSNKLSEKKSRLSALKAETEAIEKHKIEISDKKNSLEIEINELIKNIEILNENENDLKNEINKLENKIEQVLEDKEKCKTEINQTTNRISVLNRELNLLEADLKVLIDTEQDKYLDGVAEIINLKENEESELNIIGLLAETITTEKKYEVAIGTALNEYLQFVIVENINDIKIIVNKLNEDKLGRVSFIENYTNELGWTDIQETVLEEPKVISRAVDKIEFKSLEYLNIVKKIFSSFVIVEDFDSGYELVNKYKDVNFVTLTGEIFWANGAITGGRYTLNKNILKRDRERQEIETQIKQHKEEVKRRESTFENLKQRLNEIDVLIKNYSEKMRKAEIDLASLNKEIHQKDQLKMQNILEKEGIIKRIRQFEQRLEDNNIKTENLTYEISEIGDTSQEIKKNMQELLQLLREKKTIRTEYREKLTKYQIKSAEIKEQKKAYKQTIQYKQIQQNELKLKNEKNLTEIKNNENEITEIEGRLEGIKTGLNVLFKERDRVTEEKVGYETNKNELVDLVNSIDKFTKEQNRDLFEYKDKINNFEIERTKKQNKIELIENNIKEFYSLGIESLEEDKYKELIDDQKIIEKLSEFIEKNDEKVRENYLRDIVQKLKSMGDVNVYAIKEYENVKKRHDFLLEQKTDIETAEKNLKEVIRKINNRAKEKFLDTFNKVNESFAKIINVLFEGGEASLVLLEPEDVLESGIDINVKPPGKKIQNINLLSGGEKALVAVGLLFALFEAKPSPFCILDEIDAPLDDANIGRFVNLLKDFVKKTQFVIITHHKKTMGIADVIYGVTMEEKGVSKILSIKFTEENKEIS